MRVPLISALAWSAYVLLTDLHPVYTIVIHTLCAQSRLACDHGPPMRPTAVAGHAQERAKPVSAEVILPHSLDARNVFLYKEEDPRHSLWTSSSHRRITPVRQLNSATPGQPNASPLRDDPDWTRSVTPPSATASYDPPNNATLTRIRRV